MLFEIPYLLPELGKLVRHSLVGARFVSYDLRLYGAWRVVELDRDESLPRAVLQVLERALVARIVGEDEQEAVGGLQKLSALLYRQYPACGP